MKNQAISTLRATCLILPAQMLLIISVAVQSWHASDGSAYALLSPWHRVFGDQLWDGLLMRSILPKLAFALQVRLQLT